MRKIVIAVSSLVVFAAMAIPSSVLAYDPLPVCTDTQAAGSAVCTDKGNNTSDPLTGQNGLLHGIATIIAVVSGIIAIIIILTAGLRYVTSGGDAAGIKSAKDAIIATVVGLVIIELSDAIISFVLGRILP